MEDLVPKDQKDLEQELLEENDPNKLKDIISLFNVNIQKKQLIRSNKLNDLQDLVYNQMSERIEKKPGEFSNKDLLDYFKVIQDTISKTSSEVDVENIPIQINQNQLNINMQDTLSKESKEKVVDALKSIFSKYGENNLIENESEETDGKL